MGAEWRAYIDPTWYEIHTTYTITQAVYVALRQTYQNVYFFKWAKGHMTISVYHM